jgi:hypothetical protein
MTNNDTTIRTRRNMNHTDCEHPATTEARTECRESAKLAGTWPNPAPITPSTSFPANAKINAPSATTVHATVDEKTFRCNGTVLTERHAFVFEPVTCKNCLKLINN